MMYALISFTLGFWSSPILSFDNLPACEAARVTYSQHASFLTKYECVPIQVHKN